MTITGQKVTDELFAEVRRHFSEAQVVELAEESRHHVCREDEDADVESKAPRLCREAERFGAVRGEARSVGRVNG